jgi:hypothetical protein
MYPYCWLHKRFSSRVSELLIQNEMIKENHPDRANQSTFWDTYYCTYKTYEQFQSKTSLSFLVELQYCRLAARKENYLDEEASSRASRESSSQEWIELIRPSKSCRSLQLCSSFIFLLPLFLLEVVVNPRISTARKGYEWYQQLFPDDKTKIRWEPRTNTILIKRDSRSYPK